MNTVSIDARGYPSEMVTETNPVTGQPQEVLKVYGVEVVGRMPASSHEALARSGIELNDQWMNLAAETYRLGKSKGKSPELLLGHNKSESEAPSIGTLENMRYERPYMVADLRVTNPEAQAMLLRGELRHRSAEFSPSNHHIWGLSLTKGDEGHFEEEWPDLILRPRETSVALHAGREVVCLSWRPTNKRNTEMTMETNYGQNGQTMQERMAAMESAIGTLSKQVSDALAALKTEGGEVVSPAEEPMLEDDEMKLVEEEVAEQQAAKAMENGMAEEEAKRDAMLASKDKAREIADDPKAYRSHLSRRSALESQTAEVARATGMDHSAVRMKLAAATTAESVRERASILRSSGPRSTTKPPQEGGSGSVDASSVRLGATKNHDRYVLQQEVERIVKLRRCTRTEAMRAIHAEAPHLIEKCAETARTILSSKQTRPVRAHG